MSNRDDANRKHPPPIWLHLILAPLAPVVFLTLMIAGLCIQPLLGPLFAVLGNIGFDVVRNFLTFAVTGAVHFGLVSAVSTTLLGRRCSSPNVWAVAAACGVLAATLSAYNVYLKATTGVVYHMGRTPVSGELWDCRPQDELACSDGTTMKVCTSTTNTEREVIFEDPAGKPEPGARFWLDGSDAADSEIARLRSVCLGQPQ